MSTIAILLPEDVLATVRKSPDEVATEMRVAVAVSWYARGLVSQGRGAEIAGLTRSQFIYPPSRPSSSLFATGE